MRAVLCKTLGSPDDLVIEELADPVPAPDEVVVGVRACGINFPDLLMVAGKYQAKPPLPFSPGGEFSGVVETVGTAVVGVVVGDRVCGNSGSGAFREKLAVCASELTTVPDNVDLTVAASFLITYGTSLYALRERANLRSGQSLLVLGAGGGVGLAAVELGVAQGARVVAAASSDEKLVAAKRAGAHELLKYPAELSDRTQQKEFSALLKERAGADGFDVIYDPVGGGYSEPALRAIGWQGRYLVVGFAAGQIPSVPLNLALLKGCQIVGVMWGGAWQHDPDIKRSIHTELMQMLAAGIIHPEVGAVLPLERAAEALRMLAERRVVGKLVLSTT
ncbi:MAG TPA: NADPH:quinone oxidoreductase family protein [Steroidobacteraceae bacterium]|jgi:NADPH2:quinone reductase